MFFSPKSVLCVFLTTLVFLSGCNDKGSTRASNGPQKLDSAISAASGYAATLAAC